MQSHRLLAGNRKYKRGVSDPCRGDEFTLAVNRIRKRSCRRSRCGNELRKWFPEGIGAGRVAHEQQAVVAQKLDGTAGTEGDCGVEPSEILEVDDGSHDAGERSGFVLQPP